MYGQLMLHMLKRGVLEGPFTSKPQDGPLPTLPAYMVCCYSSSDLLLVIKVLEIARFV